MQCSKSAEASLSNAACNGLGKYTRMILVQLLARGIYPSLRYQGEEDRLLQIMSFEPYKDASVAELAMLTFLANHIRMMQ